MKNRRKIISTIILLLLVFVTGCEKSDKKQEPTLLTVETDNLPHSLKEYFSKNTETVVEGNTFQLKSENVLRILPNESDRYYFRYHFYIAPRTTKELVILSVKVLPNSVLATYLSKNLPPYNGSRNEGDIFKSPDTDISMTKPNNYSAVEYITYIDNNGTANMINTGYTLDQFTQLMGAIQIEIRYLVNDKVESEVISFEAGIPVNDLRKEDIDKYSDDVYKLYTNNEVLKSYGVMN